MNLVSELLAPPVTKADPQADPLICHCFRVTESVIKRAIHVFQAVEVEAVMEITQAGGGCRACHCRIDRLIEGKPAECGRLCQLLGQCSHQAAAQSPAAIRMTA